MYRRIVHEEVYSDSEDEGEEGRKNEASHKKGAKRARVEDDKKEGEEKKAGESVSRDKEGRGLVNKDPVRSVKFHRVSSPLPAEIKEEEKTKEISGEKSDSKMYVLQKFRQPPAGGIRTIFIAHISLDFKVSRLML